MENNNNRNNGHESHDYTYRHDDEQQHNSMGSHIDQDTGSNMRGQGMGNHDNFNDAAMDNSAEGSRQAGQEWEEGDSSQESVYRGGSRDQNDMEGGWDATTDTGRIGGTSHDINEGRDGRSNSQSMGGRGNEPDDWDAGSHSMSSDDDGQAWRDRMRSSDSKTFNEDEPAWKARNGESENVEGNDNEGGSGADYGSRNAGTGNNNWDANDQMKRGSGIRDGEEDRNAAY
ncbi:hypothetical protein CHU92_01215 [Flavobacterium cyanobacteriorum]|uniref:Uncharacterized protein n=1 Tax=Flavobacterium cyanobacteriorum TaxID=2022802 RepID=A0A255ZZW2_9FLAO|nr:hypothetical protein [Flavobacterium cyanobacteriorum]OYQ46921.1 hypothetical protein CHU92_01215 [Flavobacterium cyanobacteriorum]